MDGKIVDFFYWKFIERDVENFAGLFSFIHSIDDYDSCRPNFAQGNREQNFPYAGACVCQTDIFWDVVLVFQVIDDFRTESIITKQDIADASDEDLFSAVNRDLFHFELETPTSAS